MKKISIPRRDVLKLLATAPFGLAVGCGTVGHEPTAIGPLLGPEESLRKLILLLGPWSAADRGAAEEFAGRFLAAPHATAAWLGESSALVQSLARRFPDDVIAVQEVDLTGLPAGERSLLAGLAQHLYSFVELRFLCAGEPPSGECQGDPLHHTRTPATLR